MKDFPVYYFQGMSDVISSGDHARLYHQNHACPLVRDFDDTQFYLKKSQELLAKLADELKNYQKLSEEDRVKFDFSPHIEVIEKFIN